MESNPALVALVAANVRRERLAAGFTLAALAEATNLKVPNLSRLEGGKTAPNVVTLKRVADALGVPVCRLLDPPPPELKKRKGK